MRAGKQTCRDNWRIGVAVENLNNFAIELAGKLIEHKS
jgi:hypothetical protein